MPPCQGVKRAFSPELENILKWLSRIETKPEIMLIHIIIMCIPSNVVALSRICSPSLQICHVYHICKEESQVIDCVLLLWCSPEVTELWCTSIGWNNEQHMITRQQRHLHLTVYDQISKWVLCNSCLPPLSCFLLCNFFFVFFFFTPYPGVL